MDSDRKKDVEGLGGIGEGRKQNQTILYEKKLFQIKRKKSIEFFSFSEINLSAILSSMAEEIYSNPPVSGIQEVGPSCVPSHTQHQQLTNSSLKNPTAPYSVLLQYSPDF